jgi:hypothetical protein
MGRLVMTTMQEKGAHPDSDLGRRERALLAEVIKQGGRCGLARVARILAESESASDSVAVRTQQLYTQLYRNQLASLRKAGLVTYCEEHGEIQVTSRGHACWADTG